MRHLDRASGALAFGLLCSVAITSAGCSDDQISRPRADSGVAPGDGGSSEPLALEAGMTFGYRGILTRRGQAQGDEQNSLWTMTVTIDSVTDPGASGSASLRFHVLDVTSSIDDWDATADFDSWVGRMGPSLRDDAPSAEPITVDLSRGPAIPPPPTPKVLPSPESWFLDVRDIEAIRAAFVDANATRSPQTADPTGVGGKWRFSSSGPDQIVYYPVKTRAVSLSYDPRGFLTNVQEDLGDLNMRPSASCRIELISGP